MDHLPGGAPGAGRTSGASGRILRRDLRARRVDRPLHANIQPCGRPGAPLRCQSGDISRALAPEIHTISVWPSTILRIMNMAQAEKSDIPQVTWIPILAESLIRARQSDVHRFFS
jgi:hypothetical protein